jgi:hypothetical protein
MSKTIKRVINVLTSLKSIIGVVAMTTYAMEHEKVAFWTLVGGAMLDEAAKLLKKEINPKEEIN